MRITAIREKTARIASPIANAYIDFSQMTCSVVAVHTDVVRDGQPVVGYGFTSNGRYASASSRGFCPLNLLRWWMKNTITSTRIKSGHG